MSQSNPLVAGQPVIEFPCQDYPVKIMGDVGDELYRFVLATTSTHAPGFDPARVLVKTSRKGRFQSMTVYITATGTDQLKSYHQALIAHPAVKMVL